LPISIRSSGNSRMGLLPTIVAMHLVKPRLSPHR
jgi:hypothetical protein